MASAIFCLLEAAESIRAGSNTEAPLLFAELLWRRVALLGHGLDESLDGRLLRAWRASKMPLARLIQLAVIEDAVRTGSSIPKGFASIEDAALVEMVERFVGDPERGPAAAPAESKVA